MTYRISVDIIYGFLYYSDIIIAMKRDAMEQFHPGQKIYFETRNITVKEIAKYIKHDIHLARVYDNSLNLEFYEEVEKSSHRNSIKILIFNAPFNPVDPLNEPELTGEAANVLVKIQEIAERYNRGQSVPGLEFDFQVEYEEHFLARNMKRMGNAEKAHAHTSAADLSAIETENLIEELKKRNYPIENVQEEPRKAEPGFRLLELD
ncbi:MAG: hypothetical protein GY754_24020 [bacterium]|nr:hypothetical protein [bacterium]